LADNGELIQRYNLSGLLQSATRVGGYARYLSIQDPDSLEIEPLFLRALKQEPNNAEILAG
jgi:hypothetical protein